MEGNIFPSCCVLSISLVDGLTTVILVGGQQLLYAPCDSVRGPSSAFLGVAHGLYTSALVFYEYFIISLLFLTYYNFKL